MCLNETISLVSKGKSFIIFITGQLFLSMPKSPGQLQWSLTAIYLEYALQFGAASIYLGHVSFRQSYFLPQHIHCTKISVNGFELSICSISMDISHGEGCSKSACAIKTSITQSMCHTLNFPSVLPNML